MVLNKASLQAKIETLIKNNRVKIKTRKQLKKYPLGSLISYIKIDGTYRKGGFLENIDKEYFTFQEGDEPFTELFENIKEMYVGSPVRKLNRKSSKKSNFPIKIGEDIIYYAKDNFDKSRFMNTSRYKKLEEWHNKYKS